MGPNPVVTAPNGESYELDHRKAGTEEDRSNMHRMGKTQELRRNFSFIPTFGFSAVLMISWEAMLNATSYSIPNGGLPAMIWMYVVSLFGMGAAVVSMAEMASMAPTSGGQYHWVSEFAPKNLQKALSYIIGWLCVLGWQAGVAGQSFTVASQVQGLIVLNKSDYVPEAWHAVLLTFATVSVAVIFNTLLAKKLPLVEGLVLILHVGGFFAILIPLWVFAPRTPSADVWVNFSVASGWPSVGLSCLVGLTGPVYALIGSDSAVHMSEEIRDASRVLPRAMIWAIVLNGTTGFIMTVTFAYCIGPLDAAIHPPYFFAFIGTFYNATGSKAAATVMTCIITLLTLCSAISNVATASRQMFAFARDRGLPAADFLSYVRPGWDIPLNSILVSMCITALLSLINLGSTVAFNAIISIGVVSLLSSYLVSITCILYKRFRNETLLPRRWSAGRYGMAFNLCAWAYVVIAYVFAFFPIGTPVTTETMNWASAVYGGIIVVAAVHYVVYARHIYIPPVSRLAKDL
ncbi:hypothetical protein MBLNU13_g03867t1 [Cladosporium sp. NU13]